MEDAKAGVVTVVSVVSLRDPKTACVGQLNASSAAAPQTACSTAAITLRVLAAAATVCLQDRRESSGLQP